MARSREAWQYGTTTEGESIRERQRSPLPRRGTRSLVGDRRDNLSPSTSGGFTESAIWTWIRALILMLWRTIALCLSTLCLAASLLLWSPTLAYADEVHVCIRPPNIAANIDRWAFSNAGIILTTKPFIFMTKAAGLRIYVFDPNAPPENAALLPIPYHTLKCPARVLPSAVLPRRQQASPEKEEARKEAEKEEAAARKKGYWAKFTTEARRHGGKA